MPITNNICSWISLSVETYGFPFDCRLVEFICFCSISHKNTPKNYWPTHHFSQLRSTPIVEKLMLNLNNFSSSPSAYSSQSLKHSHIGGFLIMRQDRKAVNLPAQSHLRAIAQQWFRMRRALFSRVGQETWSLCMGWDGKHFLFFFLKRFLKLIFVEHTWKCITIN